MYKLTRDRQIQAISALAEGASIRSVERMTEIHRDTIMRLGVRVGDACGRLLDEKMRNLSCENIQVDEIWGYVGKKQKNVSQIDKAFGLGSVWTFIAIDANTKAVPCFKIGQRDSETANAFISDLSTRLKNRIQISSDSLPAYVEAIDNVFGCNVDYGQIVKTYSTTDNSTESRYSPAQIVSVKKTKIIGNPEKEDISTSYIERQNLTMRMHCRRLTRLTNAFSKKLENFKSAVALHFGYYNFVKIHNTLRMTPAMAVGAVSKVLTVGDLVDLAN